MESNEVLDRLPHHLLSLVIEQPYKEYTAQDHAVWRYVMRQNVRHLPQVAHSSYLQGLKKTGISIDRIPQMYGMNRILKEIGWAAVAVDGFIPPAAFMEFQSYNVLVIAADIRPVDQIQYTPAPDIIHEAAGHAPIIADHQYATYLREFGKLGSKAFSSVYDTRMYEAIRHLSILKADPYTPTLTIDLAEQELDNLTKLSSGPSEMALLRNLHWWTVEYGLIGNIQTPKIYGAGLLSSIGESYNCLTNSVKKFTYSIDAQHVNFDITRQQPQLFVTPDFDFLGLVLEQFAGTLALRNGGINGLTKAVNSGTISTVVYSSGLQVSGILSKFIQHDGSPAYITFTGPSSLSLNDEMLEGHGPDYHSMGFGSPVGRLNNISTPIELLTPSELDSYSIKEGEPVHLQFESGVDVNGLLTLITRQAGKNILFSFTGCTVSYLGETLFHPDWGVFDMAIGASIPSVFSGPADPASFGFLFPVPAEKTHKLAHSEETKELHNHFQTVRDIRRSRGNSRLLGDVFRQVCKDYAGEWLLPLEIYEILDERNEQPLLKNDIRTYLEKVSLTEPSNQKLIRDGLESCTL